VIEHVRPRLRERQQRPLYPAAKIRRQYFDADARHALAQQRDTARKVRGAAVAQIIAIHRRDHDIAQTERRHRFGEPVRLALVQRFRSAMGNIAERTTASANAAHDHERRGALRKTFADVWTHSLLTHRMQAVLTQDRRHAGNRLAHHRPGMQPRRFRQDVTACQWDDLHRDPREFVAAALAMLAKRSDCSDAGAMQGGVHLSAPESR
jgi:hypothetical protein